MNTNTPLHTKTSFWQKILLVILGVFLTLILIETGLRIGGFIILSLQEYRNKVSLKQKNIYTIMCLGESTTANQYPSFLKEALNQRNIGIKFNVIDKGIYGINTSAILSTLESNLDAYHPDMVITMMAINDSGSPMPYEFVSDSKAIYFLKAFKTYKLTRLLWLHIVTRLKELGFYKPNKHSNQLPFPTRKTKLEQEYTEEKTVSQRELKKAIETNPRNNLAYVELGILYREQGKFSDAEESYNKALEINPRDDRTYVELGLLYRMQGKLSDAEESYNKALEINPRNNWAQVGLGRVYRRQGKFSEDKELCNKALEINPRDDQAYVELGRFYWRQGKLSEAEDSYKKALEINPRNNWAYVELWSVYQKQGKFSEAEESCKKIIELNPREDKAYGALEVLYIEMGNLESAKKYAKKAKELRSQYYFPITTNNYHKLKTILDKRSIVFVCVQYPARNLEPLKKIFLGDKEGIIFVDNEQIFRDAVAKYSYQKYFKDMFGGDFGHCTPQGNRLLAEHIAHVIVKEVFGKKSQKPPLSHD